MNTQGVARTPVTTLTGGDNLTSTEIPCEDPYIANDFHPLALAGKEILNALREDESAPDADLYRRITSSSSAGSHRYHVVHGDGTGSVSKSSSRSVGGSPSSSSPVSETPGRQTPGDRARHSQREQQSQQSQGNQTRSPFVTGAFRGSSHVTGSQASPTSNEQAAANDRHRPLSTASPPTWFLNHDRSIPLPAALANEAKIAQITSAMGIFPEANLVWLSSDDKLFLWSYKSHLGEGALDTATSAWGSVPGTASLDDREDFCSFSVPNEQCIITVGLVRPKKGVFKDSVEWCIVLTTPEEAILCALARENPSQKVDEGFRDGMNSILRLIPTRFVLPTDSVPLISICGSKDGRIFMGGSDGCVYEMSYEGAGYKLGSYADSNASGPDSIEDAIDEYFDGDGVFDLSKNLANGGTIENWSGKVVNGGKRVFSALTFGSLDDMGAQRARKCRKINHSSSAAAMIPSALGRVRFTIFGFGMDAAAIKGGPIVSLVLDDARSCLYTLGANGVICAYDLSPPLDKSLSTAMAGSSSETTSLLASPPRLASVFDSVASAKLYLECVQRNRMHPPATAHAVELGVITFPGGIASAKAGVGGMEGARHILKRHEIESRSASSASNGLQSRAGIETEISAGILQPVSIHLIPRSESKSLTLVAITGGGLRYYLSSLSSSSISSAQASQGGFDYSGARIDYNLSPTRPSTKMNFCHIRAPPPYTAGDGNDEFRFDLAQSAVNHYDLGGSGLLPGIHDVQSGVAGKIVRGEFSKGFYGKGIFILALNVGKLTRIDDSHGNENSDFFESRNVTQISSKPFAGDAIVAALPDCATRLSSAPSMSNNIITTYAENPTTAGAGGISECILLPMASVGGSESPILPGGTTFDIVASSGGKSSLLDLFVYSETPSDTELRIGLITPFAPPISRRKKSNQSSSTTLTVSRGNESSVIPFALSAITNYLRSGERSGYQVGTIISDPNDFGPSVTYRVSRRHGCDSKGFSDSAAECFQSRHVVNRSRSGKSRGDVAKSSRLPSWLLRPLAAPLNPKATQHLLPPGSRTLLLLNAGGLHFFQQTSLLNNFASVLLRAKDVAKDTLVQNFFTSYGHAEVCAMCFALATSSSSSDLLKHRAGQTALCHGHQPCMKLNGPSSIDGNQTISSYTFQSSFLYEGMVKYFSRLLRPFWYKPAVVVTEGRPICGDSIYSNYYQSLPAKVELLLNDASLDEIRQPLVSLQNLMKRDFKPAVKSIPGASSKSSTDAMEIDEDGNSGGLITSALQRKSREARRIDNAYHTHSATAKELMTIARQTEDRNMHALYRLLSRCVQMLNLMSCLKHAHANPSLPEIQWGLLHGLTFSQLITSEDGQQRVDALLNGVVSLDEKSLTSGFSTDADSLANTLSRQCYLFFSASSRLTYSGFRYAWDARSMPLSSPRRSEFANQAASYFRAAARHWYNPTIIVGRLFSKETMVNFEDAAESAMDARSPLALAAKALMELGNAKGVADVCLICASNFGGAKVPRDESKEFGESFIKDMFDWERGLYHQPQGGEKSSDSKVIVTGFDVTASDAKQTCHSILFFYISKLLGSDESLNHKLADELVAACASSSDADFLRSMYEHLLNTNQTDTLLRIDSSSLETWLETEKRDYDLLRRYYSFHNRNVLAGEIMMKQAESEENVHLKERIQCLTRAMDSFSAALQTSHSRIAVTRRFIQGRDGFFDDQKVSLSDLNSRIHSIQEKLDIAKIQQRVLNIVELSENVDLEPAKSDCLAYSLVNVSDLYNEYASVLNLFDICLLIIETCRHDQRETITYLWKNIICEEILPSVTNSESVVDFLNNLKHNTLFETSDVLIGEDPNGQCEKFDSGEWIARLKNRVSTLGKELYNTGTSFTFPLDFLVMELEGLRKQYDDVRDDIPSQPWPIQSFIEAEIPFSVLLESYDRLLSEYSASRLQGVDYSTQFRRLSNISYLLEAWAEAAYSYRGLDLSGGSSTNNPATELARAVNPGGLLTRISSYRSYLDGIGESAVDNAGNDLVSRLTKVEVEIRDFFR